MLEKRKNEIMKKARKPKRNRREGSFREKKKKIQQQCNKCIVTRK